MAKEINTKCFECAQQDFPHLRPTNIRYKQKPDCWVETACPKKRSYYRKLDEYRQKQREYHEYIKYKGDKCVLCKSKDSLEVHHVLPQYHEIDHNVRNLITLCLKCHRIITAYHRTIKYIE